MSRSPIALQPQTSRRLHNQIERALRRTYGATSGLRILAALSTRELLGACASREQIRQALVDSVHDHAPPPGDGGEVVSTSADEGQREMLVDSMVQWADHVCATAKSS